MEARRSNSDRTTKVPPWISVEALAGQTVSQRVEVRGWVRTRRDSKGGFSFIEINDGSCFGNLQIIADATLDNYEAQISRSPSAVRSWRSARLKASEGARASD